jgi:hypothetical protein
MDAIKRQVGRKFRAFLMKFVDPSTGECAAFGLNALHCCSDFNHDVD